MIANAMKMFGVPLELIGADDRLPFAIYLHFPRNGRYIGFTSVGDQLGAERTERLRNRGHTEVWLMEAHRPQWQEYRDQKTKVLESTAPPAPQPTNPVASVAPAADGVFEETEIVSEVLQDKDLSPEAKAEILASLGQDLLRAFNQISNKGEQGQQEAVRRGRQIADEILAIAAQNSNFYADVLALRQSKQEIEHSIMVSTLSVMFGLALGYSDEIFLADLATAGLFHDIGLTRVNPLVLAKRESEWSATEITQYQEHVEAGIMILRNAQVPYPETVFTMIRQHHENYDGSGFPDRLQGVRISEGSQIVHLANWFDRLSTGKISGQSLTPGECIEKIFEVTLSPKAVKEVRPEIIQRVFQFMLEEKNAAENLHYEANQRAEAVKAAAIKTAS